MTEPASVWVRATPWRWEKTDNFVAWPPQHITGEEKFAHSLTLDDLRFRFAD